MATTGIVNGTLLVLYVNDVAIASTTQHTLSLQMATRDATNKSSSGWSAKLPGVRSWSATGSGLFAFDAAYGYDDLFGLVNARTLVTVKLSTEVSGDKFYQGSAYLTDVQMDSPTEENTTFSFTFEGTGALSELSQT